MKGIKNIIQSTLIMPRPMSTHKHIVLYAIMAMFTITKIKFVKNNLINNVYTIMMNQTR